MKQIQTKNFTDMVLVDGCEVYSANPSDYFLMDDTYVFNGLGLGVKEHNKGWIRNIVIKDNPTKKDLIDLNKELKQHI